MQNSAYPQELTPVKFKLTMEDALVYLTNVDPARSTRGMGSL